MINSLGVICAKNKSLGFPGKNLVELDGKPLIVHSIESASVSNLSRIIVSTDGEEIAKVAKNAGAEVTLTHWQSPRNNIKWALRHAVEYVEKDEGKIIDFVMLLQATSPFRTAKDINYCLGLMVDKYPDSVVSVFELYLAHPMKAYFIEDERLVQMVDNDNYLRQELPKMYAPNGAIFCVKRDVLIFENSLYGEYCYPYIMGKANSIQIDDEVDLIFAKGLIEASKHRVNNL